VDKPVVDAGVQEKTEKVIRLEITLKIILQ
jgi:hypothetical protein